MQSKQENGTPLGALPAPSQSGSWRKTQVVRSNLPRKKYYNPEAFRLSAHRRLRVYRFNASRNAAPDEGGVLYDGVQSTEELRESVGSRVAWCCPRGAIERKLAHVRECITKMTRKERTLYNTERCRTALSAWLLKPEEAHGKSVEVHGLLDALLWMDTCSRASREERCCVRDKTLLVMYFFPGYSVDPTLSLSVSLSLRLSPPLSHLFIQVGVDR